MALTRGVTAVWEMLCQGAAMEGFALQGFASALGGTHHEESKW